MRIMNACALTLLTVLPLNAAAEQVAFLGIESRSASPELVERVRSATRAALELNGDVLVDSGDATMPDLLLLVGCSSISDTCIADLASALEAESIIYGSLMGSDDATMVSLVRFTVRDEGSDVDASFDVQPFLDDEALLVDVLAAILGGRSVLQVLADDAATVVVDGVGDQPAPATFTMLFPGPHTVTARRDNAEAVRTVELGVSEVMTVSLASSSFVRVRGGDDRGVEPADRRESGGLSARQGLGVGLAAVGVGAAGAGVAFALRTQSLQDDFDAETRQRAATELADDGRQSAVLTNVAFGFGAAALGAGIWLLVTGRDGDAVSLRPWGPTGFGATVVGRF
jgi:hypothetical protein